MSWGEFAPAFEGLELRPLQEAYCFEYLVDLDQTGIDIVKYLIKKYGFDK